MSEGPKTPASGSAGEQRMDLPRWDRARKKRKAPASKEQDAFVGSVRRAGRIARMRAPLVIGGAVVLAGVIAGVVWYQRARTEAAARATRLLANAVAYESRARIGDAEGSLAERERPLPNPVVPDEATRNAKTKRYLRSLEERAPDSAAALSAGLVRGARANRAGDHETAAREYRAFLEEADADHPLRFLAREGLALALEAQGDVDGALAALDDLADGKAAFYRDQALWQRGRILEAAGRVDEAKTVYRQYAEEYPLEDSSIAREQVRERLLELEPSLVPAPPPPAAGNAPGVPAFEHEHAEEPESGGGADSTGEEG
jgi:tetratricopeptide (TPR) repeat protein